MIHARTQAFVIAVVMVCLSISGCGADSGATDPVDTASSSGADTASSSGADTASSSSSGADTTSSSGTDTASSSSSGADTTPPRDLDPNRPRDQDSDSIIDADEGDDSVDTDGDGTPDYLDDDSDDDGILDVYEAGDFDPATPPIDSDGDDIPDFQDDDSDNNGVSDTLEGQRDTDGDGTPDHLDSDDDGDGFPDTLEIASSTSDCDGDGVIDGPSTPEDPRDCDGDGVPDYQDSDSDNDGIPDLIEGSATDSDGDSVADRYDDDSDNDGVPDSDEGYADSDNDTIPNFRDPDSDGDGLADAIEWAEGTDPYSADSDDDGVSDLIELAAGTNPLFDGDTPLLNGDFIFVLPYQETPQPTEDTLAFRTNFQQADVYFLVDRTGSMLAEINAMRNAIDRIISNLTCARSIAPCSGDKDCADVETCGLDGVCIEDPAQSRCIPSFWTGSGVFGGDPTANYFDNLQAINADGGATASVLPLSVGNYGTQEAMFAAVQCLVDGAACDPSWVNNCVAGSGGDCVGYRQDSARIFVMITDEDNEWTNASFTATTAGDALTAAGVSFIGIDAADGGPGNGVINLTELATASSSIDSNGQPFIRAGDGPTIIDSATDAISELVNDVPIEVTIEAIEVEGDDGDALRFLDYFETNTTTPDPDGDGITNCEVLNLTTADGADADAYHDIFEALKPGRRICWTVYPKQNDVEEQGADVKLFELQLIVRGNGAILDQRTVYFLIPPRPPEIIF